MIYFLQSQKIFDVCTIQQDDNPSAIASTTQHLAGRALMDSLVVDESLISDLYKLLNKLQQLATHNASTTRSLQSRQTYSSNSTVALASNTNHNQKRPNKRPKIDYSCNNSKHDSKAPHPPHKCWTLYPELREEFLAKKKALPEESFHRTSTQVNINTQKTQQVDTKHAPP
ncbi:hypothetical protein PSTG_00867 [Puccinia striiformis f. sp. tritici PST-78]|uniref:Uncharacterized protein n=1 Tax=Puccinia striiformis f. sp. tritici PST-78 TaxID=1165861 RepID=A0A0L0W2V4_9BASI|nr:hypothetical protein PSTG_00867 [Puccinia striiformis f. sp. tritici PST-78]